MLSSGGKLTVKLFKFFFVILQPLQSINLAQERSAEQEQQARAEAALNAKASPAPSLHEPGVNFGATEPASNLALARHFQMQAHLQAQQLEAVGLSIQQQQLEPANLPGMGPELDPSSVLAAMATHPEAYQQLLNSMLAQQGRTPSSLRAMLPGAPTTGGMLHVQPSAVVSPHGLPPMVNSSTQYPQGLGSMPLDTMHWMQAQVGAAATVPTRQKAMPDLHMMPQAPAVLHDSQATPSMHQSSLYKLPPDQLPAGVPLGNWGLPTGSTADMHSMGLAPGFRSQAETLALAAQAQLLGGPAVFQPGNLENQQLPFGGEQQCV